MDFTHIEYNNLLAKYAKKMLTFNINMLKIIIPFIFFKLNKINPTEEIKLRIKMIPKNKV